LPHAPSIGDVEADGKPGKQRLTIKRVFPTRYKLKFELALEVANAQKKGGGSRKRISDLRHW